MSLCNHFHTSTTEFLLKKENCKPFFLKQPLPASMEFYDAWNYAESQPSMEFYDAWNYAESQQEQVGEADEKVDLEAQGVKQVFLAKCWQQ